MVPGDPVEVFFAHLEDGCTYLKYILVMLVNYKYFKREYILPVLDKLVGFTDMLLGGLVVERAPVEYLRAICPETPLTPTETNEPRTVKQGHHE